MTVRPEDTVETLLRTLREHELPGVPVVNGGGRCIGIVTESDLVLRDEEEDLRLPLHIDLFGGTIFLGPVKRFEDRLKKAIAATVEDMMTQRPDHRRARHRPARGRAADRRAPPQPPAGRRARPARRRRHAPRRARGARLRGVAMALRALARVDLAAVERNCERLRFAAGPQHRAVRGREGERLRARHGPGRARGARRRRELARGRGRGRRRPSCAPPASTAPLLMMGALSAEELPVALERARRRRRVAARRSSRRCATPRAPRERPLRVHVKLDVGMGRLGIRDADELLRVAEQVARRARAGAGGRDDAPAVRRRGRRAHARGGRALPRVRRAAAGAAARRRSCTPPTAPRRSRCPRAGSTWCAAAWRSTGSTRSASTPPRTTSSRRSSCARTSAR